ncbi:ankyrin repeat domain-containing protein 9 [Echinops telfairi]|uniref:Ankyrin repeat domain-containing protein 9 n=1 Tax=Echinops telfairi TaxID=9371 RepID=A0ABM0IFW3_ECHTE|nr:ankyrin repeat domain-containing protein 9 [Echinops telfairi]
MPWDARRPGGGAEGGPEGAGAARSQAQKQCRKSSFAFYQAVRDQLPVWLLEDMRASEAFHWDERGRAAAYSPSEALLYALVHDHQAYAHYLLATFPALYTPAGTAGLACHELLGDRPRWQRLLGDDKFQWLAGLAPPSLFTRAMQVLVTAISPSRFPEALDELPLPPFLQPLDLTGKG